MQDDHGELRVHTDMGSKGEHEVHVHVHERSQHDGRLDDERIHDALEEPRLCDEPMEHNVHERNRHEDLHDGLRDEEAQNDVHNQHELQDDGRIRDVLLEQCVGSLLHNETEWAHDDHDSLHGVLHDDRLRVHRLHGHMLHDEDRLEHGRVHVRARKH